MKKEYVAIVGAGLAGSLLAVYLARRGFRVDVYERRPDMRREAISAGRSINLALSVRGIHALQEVGLAGNILTDAIPMKGRMMHSTEGELTFQPYGKDPREVINSVSRGGLNMLLLDAAESYDDVQIFFDERCTGADLDRGELQFRNERSGKQQVVTADAVIASDGSASAVRMEMQKIGRFNLSQQYLEHG
ncbi:MAG: FAD-dependent monooxygenase, partial [Calditrichaeota bacterium]|nr:FAD-dependent monooxygenase [Calditrichota bacterium]